MQLRKLFYLMLIVPMLFLSTACSEEEDPTSPEPTVNEAEVLAKQLETTGALDTYPAMIKATEVKTYLGDDNYAILDIRGASDFAEGHIQGAVNVASNEVVDYYENNNLQAKTKVIVACYTGQTAGWATSLLRVKGYSNVYDLKWGMSSWNPACDSWSANTTNGFDGFVTEAAPKNAKGDLPKLDTKKTAADDILDARVDAVLAEGFGKAAIAYSAVTSNPEDYYIVNYWAEDHYNLGHIPTAVQYSPKTSLKLDADLKTLPTDKTIVVYCYTGQTSAHVAAYLRTLGYDAKSLKFGINQMRYDWGKANGLTVFNPETEIHDYELVK